MKRRKFLKSLGFVAGSAVAATAVPKALRERPTDEDMLRTHPVYVVKSVKVPDTGLYPGKVINISEMHMIELWHEAKHGHERCMAELKAVRELNKIGGMFT